MKKRKLSSLTLLRLIAVIAGILLLTEILFLHDPKNIGEDFVIYWTSGRLLIAGVDPYDLGALYELQKSVEWSRNTPMPYYNPPWALPFILPFCFQNYPMSKLIWVLTNALLLVLGTGWLWNFYAKLDRPCASAAIRPVFTIIWVLFVMLTFVPIFTTVMKGQILPFMLLGIVAFLHFEKRGQFFMAGAVTAVIAMKPHILYLFWIALAFWIVDRRRWSVALGGGLAFLSVLLFPLLYNGNVVGSYFNLLVNRSPALQWYMPTIGTYLRLLLGMERHWLQFVPAGFGTLWFIIYWRRHRTSWEWSQQLPLILLVSLMTTFYVWLNDFLFLLPLITLAAIRAVDHRQTINTNWAIWAYLLINSLVWAGYIVTALFEPKDPWISVNLPWVVPSFLIVYLLLSGQIRRRESLTCTETGESPAVKP
jgi:hypothetical protein